MRKEALERARAFFDMLDANNNGTLGADDFELMAERVVEAVDDPGDAAAAATRSAFRNCWATFAREMDANGDGMITFDEFTACAYSPERYGAALAEFAEAFAMLGDPRDEGYIDRPRYEPVLLAFGFGRAHVQAAMDALTDPETGRIARADFVAGTMDYFNPDKADTPGDHLVPST